MAYEGRPAAYWVLLGPEVDHRSSAYDTAAAREAIRSSGYPDPDELIELLFDEPPEPGEVADYFERRALGQVTS